MSVCVAAALAALQALNTTAALSSLTIVLTPKPTSVIFWVDNPGTSAIRVTIGIGVIVGSTVPFLFGMSCCDEEEEEDAFDARVEG